MRLFTKFLIFLMVIGLAKLNNYTKSPHITPAQSQVLKTITHSLGGGLLMNTVCGIAAPRLDPDIPSSDSFMSCSPFGLSGALIITRVHIFTAGGWKFDHWSYFYQLPRIAENGIRGALGFAERPLPRPDLPIKTEQFAGRAEL